MTDNIIPMPMPRKLTEDEARAVSTMFWMSNVYARMTVAGWLNRTAKKPTHDEMFNLARQLKDAEDAVTAMVDKPPGDGRDLNSYITFFEQALAKHATTPVDA